MLTVGEILKKEREKKGYSLLHIGKKIRIRETFLQAIEENNWSTFTSRIYIEGIIKNYALFLGLDPKRAMAFFRRDYEKKDDVSFRKAVTSKHLVPESKKYATLGIVVLVLLFLAYFGYQLKLYFSPPRVQLIEPKETQFKKVEKVRVMGKTEKEAVVTIYKDRIFQNSDGIFIYDYILKKGRNILTIEVTGANGKKTILTKEFYLSP